MNKANLTDVTSHLKTLEKSGVYYTQTADLEDVMIYHFKNEGTRVVFFKKDHSVLEVIYGPDCQPLAMKNAGTWDNQPRPREEEKNSEKEPD